EVAQMLREMEIDIGIDLAGYTTHCRPGILAHRPMPIQASYLGFAGTMGSELIDYIVADATVIPEGAEEHYAEKVVRLPETFQPNDATRRIAERTPTRAEVGLPERGMVYCSFNNAYKIAPEMFEVWMRVLQRVEGSVLWLQEGNAQAKENLRGEAERRGVRGERLLFAGRVEKLEDHLA